MDTFECFRCCRVFTWDFLQNHKLRSSDRYPISKRQWINGQSYCRRCADIVKDEMSHNYKKIAKEIALSLNLPVKNACKTLGTCEILKAHHNIFKQDPERLKTDFLIGLICGTEGQKKYRTKKSNEEI